MLITAWTAYQLRALTTVQPDTLADLQLTDHTDIWLLGLQACQLGRRQTKQQAIVIAGVQHPLIANTCRPGLQGLRDRQG